MIQVSNMAYGPLVVHERVVSMINKIQFLEENSKN
jgi:hypothetical protein